MRSKKPYMTNIGVLIRNGRNTPWKKKMTQYALWERWEQLVGPVIAGNARPASWRNQTLVITVVNHAWIQELQFLRKELLDKIKEIFPMLVVKNIRFELGVEEDFVIRAPATTSASPRPSLPLTTSEVEFARDSVRPIDDDETRSLIRRIIEKDLTLKKRRD